MSKEREKEQENDELQTEEGPTEKLRDDAQPGSLTPGTQKQNSEVQNEKGTNTE